MKKTASMWPLHSTLSPLLSSMKTTYASMTSWERYSEYEMLPSHLAAGSCSAREVNDLPPSQVRP
jgi:hypothetical protein